MWVASTPSGTRRTLPSLSCDSPSDVAKKSDPSLARASEKMLPWRTVSECVVVTLSRPKFEPANTPLSTATRELMSLLRRPVRRVTIENLSSRRRLRPFWVAIQRLCSRSSKISQTESLESPSLTESRSISGAVDDDALDRATRKRPLSFVAIHTFPSSSLTVLRIWFQSRFARLRSDEVIPSDAH